jgi:hypothetical protein
MTLRRYEWSTFAQYSYSSSLLENDPDHKAGTHMGRPRFIVMTDLSRTLVQPVARNTVFRTSCSYGDENEWISGGEEGNTGILGRENPFGGVHMHDVLPPWRYPSEDLHCKLEGKMLPTAEVTSHAPLLTFPGDQDARQERRFSILRVPEAYIKTGAWARPVALMGRTDGWHTIDDETKLNGVECRAGAAIIIQVHISRIRGTHEESGRQVPLRVKYADSWTGALMFADSAVANGDGGEISMHGVVDCQGGMKGPLVVQVGPGPDVLLPDDHMGGRQTRRITAITVPITGLAHQTWKMHKTQSGSSTSWAALPTPMQVGVALENHQAITVWADLSLIQCNSIVEFRIMVNSEEVGYVPFRCPLIGNAESGVGSISFHGVSWKLPAGVHAVEVQYKVDRGDVVFPSGEVSDMQLQERRLTVLATEGWPLADVQGSDDLALLRTATMSSTSGDMVAAAAVDGDVFGAYPSAGIACTAKEQNAWWRVDLGGLRQVGIVDIYGATQGSDQMACASCTPADPLGGIYVVMQDDNAMEVSNHFLEPFLQSEEGYREKKKSVVFEPYSSARYVRIEKRELEMLCITEVLVFERI